MPKSLKSAVKILLYVSFFTWAASFSSAAAPQESHTVIQGDTLYSIAKKYDTSFEKIMQTNSLKDTFIYPGQNLFIPAEKPSHIVVKGENLLKIARLYNTTVEKIKQTNGLSGDKITTGQLLFVDNNYRRPEASVIGYYTDLEAHLPSSMGSATTHLNDMSQIAPFWFRLNQYDPTDLETAENFNSNDLRKIVTAAHAKNIPVTPVIHNFLYRDRSLPKKLVSQMLSTEENRKKCIENIISLIEFYNFDGVNMDFEGIRLSDRDKLSLFYSELGNRLRKEGYLFSVAIPAKESSTSKNPWAAPYDYAAIGRAADKVIIMMYNEHGFPGSGAGPISSIGFNHSVAEYATKVIPSQKIILAEPVFGFDFNLKTGKYDYLSHELAMKRVAKYKSPPLLDAVSQTPFFTYTDENGHPHEVWYENAFSLKKKLDLVREYNLGGIALWRLGMEDPEIWEAISEKIKIKKPLMASSNQTEL